MKLLGCSALNRDQLLMFDSWNLKNVLQIAYIKFDNNLLYSSICKQHTTIFNIE